MLRILSRALIGAGLTCAAFAQSPVPPASQRTASDVDSDFVANSQTDPATQGVAASIWSTVVSVPNAAWMRLYFDGVLLSGERAPGGRGSYLRITSLQDGHYQTQHSIHVEQWQNTSAYFNGNAVLVEIIAYPGTGPSRFALDEIEYAAGASGPDTICGPTDDRTLSMDPRCARNQPSGCTSWLIDDCEHCFLTAGHCSSGANVVQFNVPLSTSSGQIQHPPPSDQYSVDPLSMQSNGGVGVGNDYAYFGVFPNSTTGLTPVQANGGQFFTLSLPTPVTGQNIRVTGYGSTSSALAPLAWYLVQKTHTGPYTEFTGTTLRYQPDTTGGNSGSPVIDDSTGVAIGIHTHGGCTSSGTGANQGTASSLPALQNVLANPRGVCECAGLTFNFPNGLPTSISPQGGTTVRVAVAANGTLIPQPGTGTLHVALGLGGFANLPMTQITPNVYDAVFPSAPCLTDVRFYFSARATDGSTSTEPTAGAAGARMLPAVQSVTAVFDYDFNTTPAGWTVVDSAVLDGGWVRATPAGNGGSRRDPATDFDGSGQCWVTGNGFNQDLDGGPTTLLSEVFDLSGVIDPAVTYARWMQNDDGDDSFDVEVSQNGGSTWILLERVTGDTSGWAERTFALSNHITAFQQVQFRFVVADQPNNSVTEAGVDAFQIIERVCVSADWLAFGAGCNGSAGVPTLTSNGAPRIGRTFTVTVGNLPTGASVRGVIGFTQQVPALDLGIIGATGCVLHTDIIVTESLTTTGNSAAWPVTVPANSGLLGLEFLQQAIVVDIGANPLGATTSNAARARIGQ